VLRETVETMEEVFYLDLLGQRDDEALVEIDDAVDVDLVSLRSRSPCCYNSGGFKVLRVSGGLDAQTREEGALDVGFSDERLESGAVPGEDGGDEGRGVRGEFGLGDEFSWREGSAISGWAGEGGIGIP
jgi:hypothetical protein